jgi:hypothetical protein
MELTMHDAVEKSNALGPALPFEPHDLRKLIVKLRWIGMEQEADRITHLAESFCGPITGPIDTD